ncbi:hypothetical protein [Antribacter gilvus]|uniref:hypothetical protein n=1 Tax=Antribacter gilvus TaxID=2304675 RepID=UPI000F789649|nr:hypothetical protein [Antribacter gilvus]
MSEGIRSAAARLSGRRIASVTYYPLRYERDDGTPGIEDWDEEFGHVPTMGVALRTSDGAEFFIGWAQSQCESGVALSEGLPLLVSEALRAAVPVTGHPMWVPLVGEPVEVDVGPTLDGHEEPVVFVTLSVGDGSVTFAAAEPRYDVEPPVIQHGMDCVMVFSGREAWARSRGAQ